MAQIDLRRMMSSVSTMSSKTARQPAGAGSAADAPRYGGVFAPVITPIKADLSPDLDKLASHSRWLLANGCDGLAILGTNSEANSFSVQERLEIMEGLVERRIPAERLMPGTGCCAIPDTVVLTRKAVELGAMGVLMLPPFYYKDIPDDGLFAAYSETIERVGDTRLKVFLYHFPATSGVPLPLGLIERLVARYPETVVGMKDSTGDHEAMVRVAKALPGFAVMSGADQAILPALQGGCAGSITAGANFACALAADIYANWKTDPAVAADAQQKLAAIRTVLGSYQPLLAVVKAIKALQSGDKSWMAVRPPLLPLTDFQADDVVRKLEEIGFRLPGTTD